MIYIASFLFVVVKIFPLKQKNIPKNTWDLTSGCDILTCSYCERDNITLISTNYQIVIMQQTYLLTTKWK